MKRKIVAVILSATLAVTILAGCGSTGETKKAEVPQSEPVVEVVEETKVEPEVVEPVEEVKEEPETPTETEPTEVATEPATEEATEEVPEEPEVPTYEEVFASTDIQDYIVDGMFDIEGYGKSTGAGEVYIIKEEFLYLYDNTWFVEVSSDLENADKAFISIGKWDTTQSDRWNINTFSYVFEFGEPIGTSGNEFNYNVSKQALAYLPLVITQMKNLPKTDEAPMVEGTEFKPCQYDDPFVQN